MAVVLTGTTLLATFQSTGVAHATTGTIQEFPITTLASRPQNITRGPDGNLWFTEQGANQIGKITPSGVVTEYPVPTAFSNVVGITAGPDGNLWFTEKTANKIGKITTKGHITEYAIPEPFSGPELITSGPGGNLWFTEGYGNNIGKISTGGDIKEYDVPTWFAGPFVIAPGPDDKLWFTEFTGNKIGKVTNDGDFTEYDIPTWFAFPVGITEGPDGNMWFTEGLGNKVAKVTTGGHFTEYNVTTPNSTPTGITAGPDGNLWFAERDANQVARITTSGLITEFPVPTAGSKPLGITKGPDGMVWFVESSSAANNIGRVTINGHPKLTTEASGDAEIGDTIKDTATLSGGKSPTGTVTFMLYAGSAPCVTPQAPTEQVKLIPGTLLTTVTETVKGNGEYTSDPFKVTATGTYQWVASYSGDAQNDPAGPTACNDPKETVEVTKADPAIDTHASEGVTLGGAIHDSAVLTDGYHAEGSITFQLYGPNDTHCEDAIFSSKKEVDGNTTYTSGAFTPTAAGTYRWAARYSGDTNNASAVSDCNAAHESVVVAKVETRIVTHASDPVKAGGSVKDSATLSGGVKPSGTITFKLYGPDDATCSTAPVATFTKDVDGNKTYTSDSVTVTKAGTYRWVASYGGDANNNAAVGDCNDPNESVVVTAAPLSDHPAAPVIVAGETFKRDSSVATGVATNGSDLAAQAVTTPPAPNTGGSPATKGTTTPSLTGPIVDPTPSSVAPAATTSPSPAATFDATGPTERTSARSATSHDAGFPTMLVSLIVLLIAAAGLLLTWWLGKEKEA
jgi:streptogramin lyase